MIKKRSATFFLVSIPVLLLVLYLGNSVLFSSTGSDVNKYDNQHDYAQNTPNKPVPEKSVPLSVLSSSAQSTLSNRASSDDEKALGNSEHWDVENSVLLAALRENPNQDLSELWIQIKRCPPCVDHLAKMLLSDTLDKSAILAIAKNLIGLDNANLLPAFKHLINPDQYKTIAIVLSERLVKNGRAEYLQLLFESIYDIEMAGNKKFAYQLAWVLKRVDNKDALIPVLDLLSGRTTATNSFRFQVKKIMNRSLKEYPDKEEMHTALSQYYFQADVMERQSLWGVVKTQAGSLVKLAQRAHLDGDSGSVDHYISALTRLDSESALEGIVTLHETLDYPQDYFVDLSSKLIGSNLDRDTVQLFERYMRDSQQDLQTRIIVAEALLSVKHHSRVSYALKKLMRSTNYEDSDLIAYVSSRL